MFTREVRIGHSATMLDDPAVVDVCRRYLPLFRSGKIAKTNTFVILTNEAQPDAFGFPPRNAFKSGGIGAELSKSPWFPIENIATRVVLNRKVEWSYRSEGGEYEYISLAGGFFFGGISANVFLSPVYFAGRLPKTCRSLTDSTIFGLSPSRAIQYFFFLFFGEICCSIFMCYRHICAMLGCFFLSLVGLSHFFYGFWRMYSSATRFGQSLFSFFGMRESYKPISSICTISQLGSRKVTESCDPFHFFCWPFGNRNPIKRLQFWLQTKFQQLLNPSIFMGLAFEVIWYEMSFKSSLWLIGFADVADNVASWVNESIDICIWVIIELRLGYLLQQVAHLFTSERGGAAPFTSYNFTTLEAL